MKRWLMMISVSLITSLGLAGCGGGVPIPTDDGGPPKADYTLETGTCTCS